jgi:enamine deaminase RidA (YjgF/YER057c/UK114 family)
VPPAAANYLPPVHTGNRLFLTGQIARDPEGKGAPVKVELVAEIEMER